MNFVYTTLFCFNFTDGLIETVSHQLSGFLPVFLLVISHVYSFHWLLLLTYFPAYLETQFKIFSSLIDCI